MDLRTELIGDGWDSLWTVVTLALLTFVPLALLLNLLDGNGFNYTIYYPLYSVAVAFIIGVTIYSRGGLVQAWIGISPLIPLFIAQHSTALVSGGVPLDVALLLILGVGTAAYVVMKLLVFPAAEYLLAPESIRNPASGETVDVGDDHSHTAPGKAVRTDRSPRRTLPVTRRQLVFTLGGGGGLFGAIFGYEYGWWCDTSPANVKIDNKTGTSIDVAITISRYGYAVFQKEITLGYFEVHGFGEPVDPEDRIRREFENALPIGCGMPEEIHVEVEADNGLTSADTVQFPALDSSSGGEVEDSQLRITVFDDEIELDADIIYGWV